MGSPPNGAVQAVGRTFFRITLVLFPISAVLSIGAIVVGIQANYFTWEMDRCACIPDAQACTPGNDFLKVNLGWEKFEVVEKVHTEGCPDALKNWLESDGQPANLDDPRSFDGIGRIYRLDGEFQKTKNPTQADENNGADGAAEAMVAFQVVTAFLGIFTYKMLSASYFSNGSHCSIGLSLMAKINLLCSIALAICMVAFWWLLEGRFGDEREALTTQLFYLAFSECWMETTDIFDCPTQPWTFDGPGYAAMAACAGAGVYILATLYMVCKAGTVEGVLDGSMDTTGAMLKPRTVEVEMVVGKALATDGDPDYDSENPLYEGEGAATMIRPYPLPKTAKAAKKTAADGDGSETGGSGASGAPAPGSNGTGSGGSSTDGSDFEAKSESDPESPGELRSVGGPGRVGIVPHGVALGGGGEYRSQHDLEMIMEGSEEDRASSSQYSETYSREYASFGHHGSAGNIHTAPMR